MDFWKATVVVRLDAKQQALFEQLKGPAEIRFIDARGEEISKATDIHFEQIQERLEALGYEVDIET